MINPSPIEAEVSRLRTEVQRRGGFTLTPERVRIICPDELTTTQHFACIAAIAQREGWSFAFLRDGSVHFGAYSAALEALIRQRCAGSKS